MIVTLADCAHAIEQLAVPLSAEPGDARSGDALTCIRVVEGAGSVTVSAALTPEEQPHVSVDQATHAVVIRCGSVSRLVPLPDDALLHRAVVQLSAESVTVTMPTQAPRVSRHRLYVW